MTKLEGKQGKGSSEPIRDDNREYPRSYTGKHSREGRYGYEQDKHVQKMSSKFNKDFKKRRHQDKKREEQQDTPHDCIRVEMCDFYGRENARDHNTDMYEIVYNEPSRPVYRRGQIFRMSIRFKDRQFEPDHDNVRLVFNFGPNPSVPKETKIYLPLTSSENRYDEEKINNWDANISRIDGNCMDVEVFIPADAPVGVWHCWVETCPEGFSYYRRDGSPYHPRSRSPYRRSYSPYRQNRGDYGQEKDCNRRSGSPSRWDWAPYYRDDSPYRRDRNQSDYSDDRRRGRSRSPFRRSRSEGWGENGLCRRDDSQSRRRSPFNRRNSREGSLFRRSHSRERRDQSTSRRYRSQDREDNRGFRDGSPFRSERGYDDRRDGSLNRRRDSFDRRDSKRVRIGGSLDRGMDRQFRRGRDNNGRDDSSHEREGGRGWKHMNLFRRDRRGSESDSNRGYRDQSPRREDHEENRYRFDDESDYRRNRYKDQRDSSPFRMNRYRDSSPSRTNDYRNQRNRNYSRMEHNRDPRDGSSFRMGDHRDSSPYRMGHGRDERDSSPFRMDHYRSRRDNSTDRMDRYRDSSPFRMSDFKGERAGSPYRMDGYRGNRDGSPYRMNDYRDQRDGNSYVRQRDSSSFRMNDYRGQRDSSPYRMDNYRGHRDGSPYMKERHGSPFRMDDYKGRRDDSRDRMNNFRRSRDASPSRRDNFRDRRDDSPYRRSGSREERNRRFRQDGSFPRFDSSQERKDGFQSRRPNNQFGDDRYEDRSNRRYSPYRGDDSYGRYGFGEQRNDFGNPRCRSSSPYQRDRGYMQQEMRRWRSYSPYGESRGYANRFDYGPKENDQYRSRYGRYERAPYRQTGPMSEFGYRTNRAFDRDSSYRQDFNRYNPRHPTSRQNSQNRRDWSPYNRNRIPYGQDGGYNYGNYNDDGYSRRHPGQFSRSSSFYGGNSPNRRNSPYRRDGPYQQGRSRDSSPFRCGRTPFRRGGSPYRRHQSAPHSLDGSPYRTDSSPFRRSTDWRDFNERRRGRSADRPGAYEDAYNYDRRDGDWRNRRNDMRSYGRFDDRDYGDRRYGDSYNRSSRDWDNRRDQDGYRFREGSQRDRYFSDRDDDQSFRRFDDQRFERFDDQRFGRFDDQRFGRFDNQRFGRFDNQRFGWFDDQQSREFDNKRHWDRYDRRNRSWEDREGDQSHYRRDNEMQDDHWGYRRGDRYDRRGYDKRDDRWESRSYDWEGDREGYWSDYKGEDYWRSKRDRQSYDRDGSYPYDFNGEVFKCKQDIFVLFNPWCKDDPTYMEDEVCRREYVLNDMGKIWIGTYRRNRGRRWVFGQFDDVVLPAVMYMMEEARLSGTDRANPIQMVRAITEMVNNRDHDGSHSSKKRKNGQGNCLMVGRWDGKYDDGVSPYSWTGSARILEQYMRTGKPVKYGQCWVFAAVTTTICRALGIPCRPVTNFVSAHDTNNSMSVDKYFSCSGDEIERGPDGDSWDSIWSFHSWNDVWMDRPDLPPGCGGWQAIDSTYQEECDGRYKCGPASLDCIRRGDIGFNYDTKYIFSEVNAEINHWQQDENSDWGFTRMRPGHYHVGYKMLTKAPEFDDDEYDEDCMNIIDEYKPRDSHQEHDRILNAFRGIEHGHRIKKHNRLYMDHEDVIFELEELPRVYIGQPFLVEMHIMNRSGETRSIEAMLSCHSMYYNGVKNKRVMQDTAFFVVPPNEHETFILRINPDDYEDKMVDMCMMKIYAISNVKETGQVWGEEDDFCFEKPRLQIQTRGSHQVGEEIEAGFTFINPLKVTLTNCRFTFEGPGLQRSRTVKCRDVKPGDTVNHVERFVPKQPGETKIVAAFTSHQLNDVYGSRKVAFKG